MPRTNPYARFAKIHEVCPDLVNFFHYVEYLKPRGSNAIPVADLKNGLLTLAQNCKTLIARLGRQFRVSDDWVKVHGQGTSEQVASLLADADHSPWQHADSAIQPGRIQSDELLELAEYVFEVGIAKGDEITLGEMNDRIREMVGVLNICSDVPSEMLSDLHERQVAPGFTIEQRPLIRPIR